MIRAVVFDMDGTLIDSESLGFHIWDIICEREGIEVPTALIKSFVGRSRKSVLDLIDAYEGDSERTRRMYFESRELYAELSKTELEPKPHAAETLAALRDAGFRLALATSSKRSDAVEQLTRLGMIDYFETVTCGEDAARSKPDPDIYLVACQSLGLGPGVCAAVEDSPNGVRSAHASGAYTILVPDVIEPTEEIASLADVVLDGLDQIPAALEGLSS